MTWEWVVIICAVLLFIAVFFVCMTVISIANARQKSAEAMRDMVQAATGVDPALIQMASMFMGRAATRPVVKEVPIDG